MLNDLRKKIDKIDTELTSLFTQRMELVSAISAYKKANGIATLDKSREQEILAKVASLAGDNFAPYTVDLFKNILRISKEYQG